MPFEFIKNIVQGNIFQSLEIFEVNGRDYFALLVLENRKGELEVIAEHLTETLEDLQQFLEKKNPLLLTINTSKVLKKQFITESNNNPELLLANIFPNLELDNFYYQLLTSRSQSVVSISKKDHIDRYLAQLGKIGIKPLKIALGISNILILEGFAKGTLMGSSFKVVLSETLFETYKNVSENNETTIWLNGITFKNWSLLGFAQILAFLQQQSQSSNLANLNLNLSNEFKNRKWFVFGVKFGLGFLLLLLFVNFLVFNHFHEKNKELTTATMNTQNLDSILNQLQKRILNKELRLHSILNSKNSKTSYYLDELGKLVPKSVYLKNMQYQPLMKPIRDDKAIDLIDNIIQISGTTEENNQFTLWFDNLEIQEWVNSVEIMDYEYLSNSSANFTLKVFLNQNE